MNGITLRPRVNIRNDELQVNTAAREGGGAVDCRAPLEDGGGTQEGRGGEEGEGQASLWPGVTESNVLLSSLVLVARRTPSNVTRLIIGGRQTAR